MVWVLKNLILHELFKAWTFDQNCTLQKVDPVHFCPYTTVVGIYSSVAVFPTWASRGARETILRHLERLRGGLTL